MKIGTVVGAVWATKKCPGLTGQILLRVQCDGAQIVAADLVGAGEGDRVIITSGSAARLEHPLAPIDATIIGILDGTGGNGIEC